MASYELDGEGNVKVFTFSVTAFYRDNDEIYNPDGGGPFLFRTTDYLSGWNWARQICREVEDADIRCVIDYCYDWIPEGEMEDEGFD